MTYDITQPSADLYDRQAEAFAKAFRKPESSQLRRFYDELARLETQARHTDDWEEIRPLVKMMNARVAYAFGRSHVDEAFYTTFTDLIRQIETREHLLACKRFLEATIGFRKLKEELDKQARARR